MAAINNLVPKLGLGAVLAFFAYGVAFVQNGATGGPVEVLGVVGACLMYLAILLTFATVFVSARRAFRSGSWVWFAVVILIWPLTYVYALVVNRAG